MSEESFITITTATSKSPLNIDKGVVTYMPHRGSGRYFEVGGEGTDDGAYVSTYMLGGSGACSPRKFFFQNQVL